MVYHVSSRRFGVRVPGCHARTEPARSTVSEGQAKGAPQRRRTNGREAFSLIEATVSLAVLSLLILGVMAGAVSARRSAEATVHAALADAVSTGFLEQLRSMQFASLLDLARTNSVVTLEIENGGAIEVPLNSDEYATVKVPLDATSSGAADRFLQYAFRPEVIIGPEDRLLTMVIDYQWQTPTDPRERFHRLSLSRSAVPQL